jgi:23S rRNA (guanosine2251-2'-O)-methyltransferase
MVVYGKQTFLYILERHPEIIEEVILSKEVEKSLFNKLVKLNRKIIKIDNKKAQALSKNSNHQGFFLRVKEFELSSFASVKESDLIVVLVGVTDIGNIGSIVRSCYALGVDALVTTNIKNLNTEGVARSSVGALFDTALCNHNNIFDLINELKHSGFTLYGSSAKGEDIRDTQFAKNSKKALFMGSESAGIPSKVESKLDTILSIKMSNDFNSLNVATATAIMIDRMR